MTWTQRWIGKQGEGFLWPIYLFVVVYLGPERWLHTDSAYTLFRILNHQSLFYDRIACELLVWPGQLLSHLGAPLTWVMQSVNIILQLMAWLAWLLTANSPFRWLYFLIFFCGGSEAFFIGYSEIGLSTLAFITAIQWIVLDAKRLPLLLFLSIAIIWLSHPAGVLFLPILVLFGWRKLDLKQTLLLAIALTGLFIAKQLIAPSNPYDAQLYSTLTNIQNFTQFANLFSVNYLLHAAWFFIPAATAIACFIVGLLKSSRLSTSIYFAIFVVDTLAAVLIYSQGDAHINMEKFFYPIAVIGMLSIGIYQWNGKKSVLASMDQIDEQPGAYAQNQTKAQSRTQQLISIPLWFLAFSMMLGIQKHLPNYAERKQLLFDLVKVQPHAKLLIQQPAEEQGANTNDTVAKIANALSQKGSLWGLSYETAIASKLIGLNETHTAKIMSPEEIKDWPTTHKQIADSLFIGAPFEQPQPINRLNHRYFRFAKNQYFASTPPTTSTTSPRLPPQ
jgi:hypothetical protein